MNNREELSQQSWLFHAWLESEPFIEYRGWLIRAYPEDGGWLWDVVEPPDHGSGWFESGKIYPSRSRALLEARRLVNQVTVAESMTQVLTLLYEERKLLPQEYKALLNSTQVPPSPSLV